MDGLNPLAPLEHFHTATEQEKALHQVFLKTFKELLERDIKAIYDYSAPHLTDDKTVVERFTKQRGLVVLRRSQTSEKLMKVIYANWISLSSKRGLSFLEFVLKMLWSNQYKIQRLYHSKELAHKYPQRLSSFKNSNNFLTSRIHVIMNESIDIKELAELAPTLTKLVPAHIVPRIAVEVKVNDITTHQKLGCQATIINDFSPF